MIGWSKITSNSRATQPSDASECVNLDIISFEWKYNVITHGRITTGVLFYRKECNGVCTAI